MHPLFVLNEMTILSTVILLLLFECKKKCILEKKMNVVILLIFKQLFTLCTICYLRVESRSGEWIHSHVMHWDLRVHSWGRV